MKFFNIFLFVFACIALTTISAAPESCLLEKLLKLVQRWLFPGRTIEFLQPTTTPVTTTTKKSIGQTILDGIVNSNPALKVASTAAKIAKETAGTTIVDAVKEIPAVQALKKAADLAMG